MKQLPYRLIEDDPNCPPMGLIVLETDETIEPEFKQEFADHPAPFYSNRIPSAADVTPDTLRSMEGHISAAAALLPKARRFAVVGYGCTSASSIIGSHAVAELIQETCDVAHVTDPLRAAIAYARHHHVRELALVTPYVAEVNVPLMDGFAQAGLNLRTSGSFSIAQEAAVVRIDPEAIYAAALELGRDPKVEGVFLSCTNLRTAGVRARLQDQLGKPMFSSNSALAWHMKQLWHEVADP